MAMSEDSDIKGMTVNERLGYFGLLREFDAAVRARDQAAVIEVLLKARFTAEQAQYTARTLLHAPYRYGY